MQKRGARCCRAARESRPHQSKPSITRCRWTQLRGVKVWGGRVSGCAPIPAHPEPPITHQSWARRHCVMEGLECTGAGTQLKTRPSQTFTLQIRPRREHEKVRGGRVGVRGTPAPKSGFRIIGFVVFGPWGELIWARRGSVKVWGGRDSRRSSHALLAASWHPPAKLP